MLKNTLLTAASITLLALSACADLGDDNVVDESERLTEQEIISNYLLEAGYPESEIQVLDDGRVIVGRDAVVTMQAAREMAGHTNDFELDEGFRQYRTTNIINTGVVQTICIEPTAEFDANEASAALDLAIQRYNDLNLQFTMVRNGGNCDATIAARIDNSGGGVAGFPAGGLPYHEFYIGASVTGNYGVPVGAHVIEHELGHCVGFRHSDYYNRSVSCGGGPTNEGDGGVGAIHIEGTPETAVFNGSVMNSCYNSGSNGVWTASDEVALSCLYETGNCSPPPPATYDVNVATINNIAGGGPNGKTASFGPFDASQYSAMRFTTAGNNGDADLYVGFGYVPTNQNYDCASAGANSNEVCEANPAQSGEYFVTIRAWSAYSGLTLSVDAAN